MSPPPPNNRRRNVRATAVAIAILAMAAGLVARSRARHDPTRLLLQAQEDLRAGRADRAEAALKALGRLGEFGPPERLFRAQVASARGRGDDALADLASIPDSNPLSPIARLLAGQIEIRRGRTRAAEAAFLAALAVEPDTVQARKELVFIYNIQQRQAELDAQLGALAERDQLNYGHLLHWTRTRNVVWNPEPDVKNLARFVAADPGDRASRLALAEGLRRLARLGPAAEALAPVPDADADARVIRVRIALDRGDEAAVESLLAGGPPDHPGLSALRGQRALARRDAPTAVRNLEVALASRPDDRSCLFGLASALSLAGDEPAARPYFERARRFDALAPLMAALTTDRARNEPGLFARMGEACVAVGRTDEARAWFKQAIARDPLDSRSQQALYRIDADRPAAARPGPA